MIDSGKNIPYLQYLFLLFPSWKPFLTWSKRRKLIDANNKSLVCGGAYWCTNYKYVHVNKYTHPSLLLFCVKLSLSQVMRWSWWHGRLLKCILLRTEVILCICLLSILYNDSPRQKHNKRSIKDYCSFRVNAVGWHWFVHFILSFFLMYAYNVYTF